MTDLSRSIARAAAIGACLALGACGDSEVVKQAKFKANCQSSGFAESQCAFLYEMAKAQADESEANFSLGLSSGISIGAASGGSRR